jgi:hypothetical protein
LLFPVAKIPRNPSLLGLGDEGKPGCQRCTKTGRICDGYAHLQEVENWREQHTGSLSEFVSPIIAGNAEELQFFHFFRSQTVRQLCGPTGSNFWDHTLLQICHHEPSIRHAAIALASLHQQLGQGRLQENPHGSEFAIRQYLKSISYLTKVDQNQTLDVALMTCLLFVLFDVSPSPLSRSSDRAG